MNIDARLIDRLTKRVHETKGRGRRRLVAFAGAPASGKSTLAAHLTDALNASGLQTQLVPMDGFHLDNSILEARGLLKVKGAPQTFDAYGFLSLIQRLREEAEVIYPIFDRTRDLSIAGAGCVDGACDTVVVEGNYLLHDAPVWRDLRPYWDMSVALDVDIAVLRQRLIDRWLAHGLPLEEARQRAEGNDLANAALIARHSLPADMTIKNM